MDDFQLPPELETLERLLVRGPRPEPSAALRRCILGSMGVELRRERILPRWRFAAAFAATVVVALGISIVIPQTTVFAMQQQPTLCEIAKRLQQLSPGLSHEESLRQAALRQIGVEAGCKTSLGDIPSKNECP